MNETIASRRTHGAGGTVTTLLRVGGATAGHHPGETHDQMRTLRVRTAMKSVPTGIDATATLDEAEERMDHEGINWLPVIDCGQLVGLITRLDIRQALAGQPGGTARASGK